MAVNGKQKGNSYERQVASFLSDLYGENFMRVPNSGAYVGGSNAIRKQMMSEAQIRSFKSDIIPGESFPRMNVEAKSYADFPFHQLFTGKVKILDTWIAQALTAEDEGDFTILTMKFNRKGQFVAVRYTTPGLRVENNLIYDSEEHGPWVIMEHSKFWALNSDTVKNLCGPVNDTK